MVQVLNSPGVSVSVIDESQFGPAGQGTVPLIVVATADNKPLPSGDGIAPGTLPENAGALFQIASQRELLQTFGDPIFYQDGGTSLHAYDLNEYGLLAAHQFLGQSGPAFMLRASLDTASLNPSVTAPVGPPLNGTFWLDLSETEVGLFKSNGDANPGRAWDTVSVEFIIDEALVDTGFVPLSSHGDDSDVAMVALQNDNVVYEKITGDWFEIGGVDWLANHQTVVTGTVVANPLVAITNQTDTFQVNGTLIDLANVPSASTELPDICNFMTSEFAGDSTPITCQVVANALVLTNVEGGSIIFSTQVGPALNELGFNVGTFKGNELFHATHTNVPTGSVAGDFWIKTTPPNSGASWIVKVFNASTGQFVELDAPLFVDDAAATTALGTSLTGGSIYVRFNAFGSSPDTAAHILRRFDGTAFQDLVYEADTSEPTTDPVAGDFWFDDSITVDIMVSDGSAWNGYNNIYAGTEIILSATTPLFQTDGTDLLDNDLWLDTSETRNFPKLFRFNGTTRLFEQIDNTDQTTPFGIVFSDARFDSGPEVVVVGSNNFVNSQDPLAFLNSDFVDPDAPNPLLFPAGTLLWNTRYGSNVVKEWRPDHLVDFVDEAYSVGSANFPDTSITEAGRWVDITEFITTDLKSSGKNEFGVANFGFRAQRAVVVRELQAAIVANEAIRAENIFFNLIVVPGYVDVLDELVLLNVDNKEVAFIIADTPARLAPDSLSIVNWATNATLQPTNNEDGLATQNYPYAALYYPWGFSTNLDGQNVMIPPSSIALMTYAYNDAVGFPWFAPAGQARGLVLNATTVGFLNDEDEFEVIILNQRQRDTLYIQRINPIANIPGSGLLVFGQKTLQGTPSALDRVNVARLVNFIRFQAELLAKPFLFEPNDEYTQEQVRVTFTRFFDNLQTLRAIFDFAVVVDSSNNTPDRVDRNELWIDIAIQPVKSIEFIFIPIRILNTGEAA